MLHTARRSRLCLELLEDRTAPAVFGNPWPNPGHLTVSFAPDGTSIEGQPSELFHDMNTEYGSGWQTVALRALQTWAVNGNINLSVVSDNGAPFGSVGPLQGNPNFGDIRFGSLPMSSNEVAVTTPFDMFDSQSGDIILNSAYTFSAGGSANSYDLATVLVHEAGHAFGLPDITDPTSVMYQNYQGPRTSLSAGDIQNLQALYGVRTGVSEGLLGNNSALTATPLTLVNAVSSVVGGTTPPGVIQADLTTPADVDYYSFQAGANANNLTVQLRTSGISLLTAQVTVFNARMQTVATASATDPTAGDLNLSVPGAQAGATYYIKVSASQSNVFGIGAYQLAAGSAAHQALFPTAVTAAPDTNNTLLTATTLIPKVAAVDARWDYTITSNLNTSTDVDYYRVVAPLNQLVSGLVTATPRVLVVAVSALEIGQFYPTLSVYNILGQPVQAEILANDASRCVLQIANVSALQVFYIRVATATPQNASSKGDYFLGADFRSDAIVFNTFAAGTLSPTQTEASYTVQNYASQLYHFVLSVNTNNSNVEAAVRLLIYDASGDVVDSLMAEGGQTVSGNFLLAAGTYRFRFVAGTKDPTQQLPELDFELCGLVRSDRIGPKPNNTTAAAAGSSTSTSSTATPSSTSAPTSSSSTSSSTTYSSSTDSTNTSTWTQNSPSPAPTQDPSSDPTANPYNDPTYTPYSNPYSPS